MAKHSGSQAGQDVLATVTRLVTAADGDTLYRDVYLRRAAELLSPIVTEAHYTSTLTNREQLEKLLAQARAAVGRQDWTQVRELGKSAAALQHSLETEEASLSAAEAVYGAPIVMLDPLSPGLKSESKRWSSAGQARTETIAVLAALAKEDASARDLYAARQRALESLAVPGAPAADKRTEAAPAADPEQQALQALEHGDAAALQRLAESMLGQRTAGPGAKETAAPRGRIATPAALAEPLPESCVTGAKSLGLERVEVTLASPEVSAAISDFVERYAPGASAATFDRADEGVARVTLAAEEMSVPREVAALFAETISHLALHLYVNSAGLRLFPLPAPRETLLIETHPEGEEPKTLLLRELGFDKRRALSRDQLEAALWKHGPRILAEHLKLDPGTFRLVCVPSDVYVRVGRDRGWGKREEWTHFDGYQVMKGGRLRALVGGNARFAGLYDLASISRDDGRENTVVRFAVIRRERLGVRFG
jgi:hypothetical protein